MSPPPLPPEDLSDPPRDAALLARSAAGETAAFECFVARHEAAALRLTRAATSSESDAEDALQEAFLAAWRSAATFRGEGSARAWMLAIARNAAYRLYRRRDGEPSELASLSQLGDEAGWGRPAPAEFVARLESRLELARCFAELMPEEREILVLRDLEGLSGEETARILGLGLPAMKSRLHRARLRLAALLRGGRHEQA